MPQRGSISVDGLYELSEEKIISKIKQCKDCNISECFRIWQNGENVKTSNESMPDKYCVKIKAKRDIDACLNYNFDRYVYMNFNFDDKKNLVIE